MNPNNADIRLKVGLLYLELKRYPEAIREFRGTLSQGIRVDQSRFYLATALEEAGETEKALDEFQRIPPESELYSEAMIHRAGIMEKKGELLAAIGMLEEARSRLPKEDLLLRYLARLYAKAKRFDNAVDILKTALQGDPDNAKLRFALGMVYDKAGQTDLTIKEMEHVIRLEPDNADALNYLGYTFAVHGIRLDEAERLILRALEVRPGDGYITDSLGWVYFQKNDLEGAIRELEKAVQLVPNDPIILEHLGDALLKKGQRERALELFERAVGLESEERTELQKQALIEKIKRLKEELR